MDVVVTLFTGTYVLILLINICIYLGLSRSVVKKHKVVRLIGVYLLFLFLNEAFTFSLAYNRINNTFFAHTYLIGQFWFIGYIFIRYFANKIQRRIVIVYLIVSTLVLFGQYFKDPNILLQFNLLEALLSNYLLMLCAFFYFYNTLGSKRHFNYFFFGVLMYSLLSISIFIFGNIVRQLGYNLSMLIYDAHAILLIIYQLLITLQWIRLNKISKL